MTENYGVEAKLEQFEAAVNDIPDLGHHNLGAPGEHRDQIALRTEEADVVNLGPWPCGLNDLRR